MANQTKMSQMTVFILGSQVGSVGRGKEQEFYENMKFIFPAGETEKEIDQGGTVVAVHSHAFDDYSVPITFVAMLNEKVVGAVEHLSNTNQYDDVNSYLVLKPAYLYIEPLSEFRRANREG